MADTKPNPTLWISSSCCASDTPLPSPTEYHQLVGSLQYLSITRLDVAFAINKLSQFMQAPTTAHCSTLKRLLHYLAGMSTHGIHIFASFLLVFNGYFDAEWAGDTDDYVSTISYILYLGGTPGIHTSNGRLHDHPPNLSTRHLQTLPLKCYGRSPSFGNLGILSTLNRSSIVTISVPQVLVQIQFFTLG
ncbi:hypothetical protein LR48_Vigan07g197400 [Vigna angularis]|uniref:Reverse transcriptase Ty1/copia-type domain-containing protein n=1 Tax=Phaseolus angularis TaxID=3914 RepID=A0A0L9UZH2_PHAAN|nr:hypothetical protein LR48_Vigan07g197400 [Vigna angularis]